MVRVPIWATAFALVAGVSGMSTFESELIVPTNHGAHVHPLAILELKRILQFHLVQLGLDE